MSLLSLIASLFQKPLQSRPPDVAAPQPRPPRHTMDEILADPATVPASVFPRETFLEDFLGPLARSLLHKSGMDSLAEELEVERENERMATAFVGGFLFFALDLDHVAEDGSTGREEFIERAGQDVRKPPPELAELAAEQVILERGALRILVDDGTPRQPGEPDVVGVRLVGWYLAQPRIPS